jgi:hypothetical protein
MVVRVEAGFRERENQAGREQGIGRANERYSSGGVSVRPIG